MSVFRRIVVILIASAFLFAGMARGNTRERAEAQRLVKAMDESYNEGDWNVCLDRVHEFFRLYYEEDDPENARDMTYAYIMLGNVHVGFADYVSGDKYYTRGLAVARKWKQGENELKCLGNLAVINCYLGNRKKAEKYVDEMKDVSNVNPDLAFINRLFVTAFIERFFGDWRKSVSIMRSALEIAPRLNVAKNKISTPLSELADMYEEHAMLDSAMYFLQRYDSVANHYKISNMQVDVQRLYMRVYIRKGDAQKALYYQERYTKMRDSLLNTRAFLNKARKFEEEDTRRTDRRIETLQFTVSRQQLILIIIGVILLLAIAFAIVILRQKRRLDTSFRQLYEKNRELMALGAEKPAAIQEAVTDAPADEEGKNPHSELAARILKVMENPDVWSAPDFSLQRLAELTESNTRYVSQAINDTFGKNFRSFTNEYRINEAMRRISDEENFGHLTMQSISESVGFRSSSNFIAAFKKQTGLTPSFFQKMAAAEKSKLDKNA